MEGRSVLSKDLYKYDSLQRLMENLHIDRPHRHFSTYTHQGNDYLTNIKFFNGKRLQEETIEKVYFNKKEDVLKHEVYTTQIKRSKRIGEPKLRFVKEYIYENDRLTKVIYEDVILGKKKSHELKYEFY